MFGFGDGEYDTEEPAEQKDGKNNAPPTATTTAAATAVEATSTVPLPDPTATTEQVALATDREINNPTSANPDTAATPTQANANSPRESQWLIIAAVGTIIFSIAIFYFPRHGLSQKFKERT
jgi:hypothetical protein